MALTSNDYQLRITYTESDVSLKPFSNVWYFKCISGTPSAGQLATVFIEDFIPIYEDLLPDSVVSSALLETQSLFDVDDFDSRTTALAGGFTTTADFANTILCAGFQLVRSTRQNKRHGSKRIGPLSEDMMQGNGPSGGYNIVAQAAADAFHAGLNAAIGADYRVAIPRSIKVDNPSPPPDQIYEIQDLFIVSDVLFTGIRHQNSRFTG